MCIDEWVALLDKDFPRLGPVTEETRERTLEEARRHRGSMRISTRRFRTDQEQEERRQRELRTPLP